MRAKSKKPGVITGLNVSKPSELVPEFIRNEFLQFVWLLRKRLFAPQIVGFAK